ncbi:HAMP domain-containing histidine kinase [bacterium]|nr:HAMP domain-containing histidine kinase [bacterium]
MFSSKLRSIPRIFIFAVGVVIIGVSFIYSQYLARQLEVKERQTIELKTQSISMMGKAPLNQPTSFEQEATDFFVSNISSKTDKVPWIITDKDDQFQDEGNLNLDEGLSPEDRQRQAKKFIDEFKEMHEAIEVEVAPGFYQNVYYGESTLLRQLRWFPFAQMLVAFSFIGIVFAGFAAAKRSEQNKVWVGLAKETAHQLGTPVSSLMAWIELLKGRFEDDSEYQELVDEMDQDIKRLEDIAERFSKIGSEPELVEVSVRGVLDRSAAYIQKRMTRTGLIKLEVNNHVSPESLLHVNPQLFNWVIENLLKNALDAIQSKQGKIIINATESGTQYTIDVIDTGKGIPKGNFKKVFEPGFTTKKRGWGLGLSLTKRIVENYHQGKIFVQSSELGEGTTFRITLPKK